MRFFSATSPALNWVKSRCSLEYQYGNLTLFRLAEVSDSYFPDPSIKSVIIMRHGKLSRIPNKGFRGITMDVMDIYPVIRYCEIKFSERLGAIKEEQSKERRPHDYVEVSPTHTAQDTLASGEGNKKDKVDSPVVTSPVKDKDSIKLNHEVVVNHNDDVRRKQNDVSAVPFLPRKPVRKKHSYEPIDPVDMLAKRYSAKKGSAKKRDSSVYEILDLALCLPSRNPSVKSRSEESPVVEALDLPEFRPRSMITVSCSPFGNSILATGTNITQQRSQQVADELTKSLDTGEKVKSKFPVVAYPKKVASGSISSRSRGTSKSSGSFKSSFHLSTRSQSSRLSRKRYICRHIILYLVYMKAPDPCY